MLRRLIIAVCCSVAIGITAAVAGYFLILALSANTHDRAIEAAMTSVFVAGPMGAAVGFLVGLAVGRPRPPAA